MPRGWRTYWQDGIVGDSEACDKRDFVINTTGNLTLVAQNLNSTLSNKPWADDDAVAAGGKADKISGSGCP